MCKNLSGRVYLQTIDKVMRVMGLPDKSLYIVTERRLEEFLRGRQNYKVFTDNSIYC